MCAFSTTSSLPPFSKRRILVIFTQNAHNNRTLEACPAKERLPSKTSSNPNSQFPPLPHLLLPPPLHPNPLHFGISFQSSCRRKRFLHLPPPPRSSNHVQKLPAQLQSLQQEMLVYRSRVQLQHVQCSPRTHHCTTRDHSESICKSRTKSCRNNSRSVFFPHKLKISISENFHDNLTIPHQRKHYIAYVG